jgi:hypothetical protein
MTIGAVPRLSSVASLAGAGTVTRRVMAEQAIPVQPLVSVTFCSRGRPEDLKEVLWGLALKATHPERVEYLIGVDPDDDMTMKTEPDLPPQAHLWVAPERYGYKGLHHYLNALALLARGHWLFWLNDDARVLTDGWDEVIAQHRDAVLWPHANHLDHAVLFPIWPKSWSDAAGLVTPTMHMDTWLQRLGEWMGCLDQVPIEILHDRVDVTGNHNDQTFAEGRGMMGPEGMSEDWAPAWATFGQYVQRVQEFRGF